MVNLEIKGLEDLGRKQQEYFKTAEQRAKLKYNAPSLSAYLLYEHQFNEKTMKQLASELKVDVFRLGYFIKLSGIPTRNRAESWNVKIINYSGRVINKLKEKADENKMSIRDYFLSEYSKSVFIFDLAKKLGASRQTIYNIMDKLEITPAGGLWERSLETKVEQKFGVSLKEHLEREHLENCRDAKSISNDLGISVTTFYKRFKKLGLTLRPRTYLKGKKHHFYGKHLSEETRRKISEGKSGKNHPMFGKHLPLKWRKNISLAHRK
jgi:hypothetical protein